MSERIKFARDWFDKGDFLLNRFYKTQENGLLFESYIYLWISLTIAAKEYAANNTNKFTKPNLERSTDRQEILYWANSTFELIFQMLENHRDDFNELSERKGKEKGTSIMDTEGRNIQYYKSFADYFQGNIRYCNRKNLVSTLITILNQIRNNLFHGGKSFSMDSDIQILRLTCPILRDVAKLCINN
jgi:hypothetical protein